MAKNRNIIVPINYTVSEKGLVIIVQRGMNKFIGICNFKSEVFSITRIVRGDFSYDMRLVVELFGFKVDENIAYTKWLENRVIFNR